ncbi:hypothetical protein [Escherichia coli]|uniref:hypothetical protein n=1 Tax=Escherichia coli TaxID=562 RepID=UPI00207C5C6C|nr:hypothetical protein [Escherichia coli]
MDKNETLLLTTSRIREMLGGISRVTFLNWRKNGRRQGRLSLNRSIIYPYPAGTYIGIMMWLNFSNQ